MLATVTAVEKAGSITGVIESDAGFDDQGDPLANVDEDDWMTEIPTGRNTLLTLPGGAKMREFSPLTPQETYADFVKTLIREIARCMSMPYNIAAGDSSDYNYASGRLDHQSFFVSNDIERNYLEQKCLDKIFARWFRIWAIRNGMGDDVLFDENIGYRQPHTWFWDGVEHVDPQKAAKADEIMLRIGSTSRGEVYAKRGKDVDVEDERAAEQLGYPSVEEYRKSIASTLHTSKSEPPANLPGQGGPPEEGADEDDDAR